MALTVRVRSDDTESRPSLTLDSPRVVVGRSESCEIRLPDPSVSHRHASIRQRGVDYIIMDEGSTNGTFVGPVRLAPGAPRVLVSGDLVRVGRVWLEIEIGAAVPTRDPTSATKEMAIALVSAALSAEGVAAELVVSVASGPDTGAQLSLTEFGKAYIVGRAPDADLVLTDEDCSRRHVALMRSGDTVLVKDLGSKNGAIVDGEPLTANEASPWLAGSALQIGACELTYEDPVADILKELNAAADEQMTDGEDLVAPSGIDAAEDEAVPAPRPAPRRQRARKRRAGGTWSSADYAVAILAVTVIGFSLLALSWLFSR